jgi:hypothetical protein
MTFDSSQVTFGKDYVKGSIPFTSDKGNGTWEFYYTLVAGQ